MTQQGKTEGALSLGKETRQLLKSMGLKARKGLGQHFLVDSRGLGSIVAGSDISQEDTVIEVGPGLGVLTRELGRRAGRVISVEIDPALSSKLSSELEPGSNITVINADILRSQPADILPRGTTRYKVVANLPYYITGAVLRHFLEAVPGPELMVTMVQKEVARAITARPGEMSLLSVGVQLYGRAEIIARVSARSFHPVPKVDSSVVRITAYKEPIIPLEFSEDFFKVVRAGFGSPRKQLANTLSHGLGVEKIHALKKLEEAGVKPTLRAESLSIQDWKRLWQAFRCEGGHACSK